ncbi:MAG: DUF3995 domain-containing protein [Saprospiraceae bacterium]
MLATVLSLLFIGLAGMHFYWSFGGSWGLGGSIPTNIEGEKIFDPSKFTTVSVGIGLLLMALFYLTRLEYFSEISIPKWSANLIGWVIPCIFLLRAIGDFTYIGFFKKIKHTHFGQLDSKYFSPLCLMIGILGIVFIFT